MPIERKCACPVVDGVIPHRDDCALVARVLDKTRAQWKITADVLAGHKFLVQL